MQKVISKPLQEKEKLTGTKPTTPTSFQDQKTTLYDPRAKDKPQHLRRTESFQLFTLNHVNLTKGRHHFRADSAGRKEITGLPNMTKYLPRYGCVQEITSQDEQGQRCPLRLESKVERAAAVSHRFLENTRCSVRFGNISQQHNPPFLVLRLYIQF